jgi:hypothetical protein
MQDFIAAILVKEPTPMLSKPRQKRVPPAVQAPNTYLLEASNKSRRTSLMYRLPSGVKCFYYNEWGCAAG